MAQDLTEQNAMQEQEPPESPESPKKESASPEPRKQDLESPEQLQKGSDEYSEDLEALPTPSSGNSEKDSSASPT